MFGSRNDQAQKLPSSSSLHPSVEIKDMNIFTRFRRAIIIQDDLANQFHIVIYFVASVSATDPMGDCLRRSCFKL